MYIQNIYLKQNKYWKVYKQDGQFRNGVQNDWNLNTIRLIIGKHERFITEFAKTHWCYCLFRILVRNYKY